MSGQGDPEEREGDHERAEDSGGEDASVRLHSETPKHEDNDSRNAREREGGEGGNGFRELDFFAGPTTKSTCRKSRFAGASENCREDFRDCVPRLNHNNHYKPAHHSTTLQ